MRMTIKNVRLAFPAIFTPQAVGDGEPAYGAKFIIPPKHAQVDAIRDAVKAVAEEKWNDKAASILKLLQQDRKVAWVEGPYLNKNGEPYDGFDGMYHLSTRSAKIRPSAFSASNARLDVDDGTIYAGCFVDAAVEFYAQDTPPPIIEKTGTCAVSDLLRRVIASVVARRLALTSLATLLKRTSSDVRGRAQ